MKTTFYKILFKDKDVIYVGLTTRTINERFKEHVKSKSLNLKDYSIIEFDCVEHPDINSIDLFYEEKRKVALLEQKYIRDELEKGSNLLNLSAGGEWGSNIIEKLRKEEFFKQFGSYDSYLSYKERISKTKGWIENWIKVRTRNKTVTWVRWWIYHRKPIKTKVWLHHWMFCRNRNKTKTWVLSWKRHRSENKTKRFLTHWLYRRRRNKHSTKAWIQNWIRHRSESKVKVWLNGWVRRSTKNKAREWIRSWIRHRSESKVKVWLSGWVRHRIQGKVKIGSRCKLPKINK